MPFIVLLFSVVSYSQEVLDKMELRDGQVFIGKVEKIKIELVEFRENETGLIYETAKKDIRYIQLSSGKILTFEDYYQQVKKDETQPPQQTQQPVVVEKGSGTSVVLVLLGLAAVVVVFLAIIGAL